MNSFRCTKCEDGFTKEENIIHYGTNVWHQSCFACSQCFRPFDAESEYYEFEGRKYCEHDFNILFAPKCQNCKKFIRGRMIKALNVTYHPDCFSCGICKTNLTDQGFIRNGQIALCHKCNLSIKTGTSSKFICFECHQLIDESDLLRFRDQIYHAYHFNCENCSVELTKNGKERKGKLYCLRCHDKMGVPVCGACHKPIDVDRERVVIALGKNWHVQHFMCAKCEKPFLGSRHFERRGLAYCEIDYHQLFGNICFICSKTIIGDIVTALNKTWCKKCFSCSFCDSKFKEKDKFYDVDLKPCCKKCFDKFPSDSKKRLKNYQNGKKKI